MFLCLLFLAASLCVFCLFVLVFSPYVLGRVAMSPGLLEWPYILGFLWVQWHSLPSYPRWLLPPLHMGCVQCDVEGNQVDNLFFSNLLHWAGLSSAELWYLLSMTFRCVICRDVWVVLSLGLSGGVGQVSCFLCPAKGHLAWCTKLSSDFYYFPRPGGTQGRWSCEPKISVVSVRLRAI